MEIRPAREQEGDALRQLARRAYGHYVERIGVRPAPMDDDYELRVRDGVAFVADDRGQIAGMIVLLEEPEFLMVDNVAVQPERQGTGIGGALLAFAERHARERGLGELRLYTHVLMTENRAMYAALGYREIARADEGPFQRVHFSKSIS